MMKAAKGARIMTKVMTQSPMTEKQESYIKTLASQRLGYVVRYLSEIPESLTGFKPAKLAGVSKSGASIVINRLSEI